MAIIYVELKTGYSDNGPAWIGEERRSKSGQTIYFNNQAFQSCKGRGIGANYYDVETGKEYWISGIKKNQEDRHWAGVGIIQIDKDIVERYLELVGKTTLDPKRYKIVHLSKQDPVLRIEQQQNQRMSEPVAGTDSAR